jgi:type IV pilus assembly protein PilQ
MLILRKGASDMINKTKAVLSITGIALFAACFLYAGPLMSAEEASGNTSAGVTGGDELVIEDITLAEPETVKAERTEEGKYYLDFKAAALINVLNVLSNLSGINFIAGTEVADRPVNMTLDNVILEDVLQAISYGCNVTYDFIPGRNIYLFRASADKNDTAPLMTRVYKLYYVKVSKTKEITAGGDSSSSGGSSSSSSSSSSSTTTGLATLSGPSEKADLDAPIVKSIEKILSERGKVTVDDRSNSLIVTDSEDRLKMVESAIAQLDRPLDQVLINVILVETFEDLDRSLGIEWGDQGGLFGTISGGIQTTDFPFRAGSVPSGGSAKDFFGNVINTFRDSANQFNPTAQSGTMNQTVDPAGVATYGYRDFSSFQIRVRALEDAQKLKILAKPKILALDNQAALIKISTNAAISSGQVTEAGGAGTTSVTVERYEIGTILRVTPLINTGGRITLTIEPTFATVAESAIQVQATGAGETGDPTIRTARTTLMVNDGQTIALGGMLFSEQSNVDRKVPFFGNIPVIGKALFTSNTKSIKDRELILFVTPYIVNDPSMLMSPNLPDKKLYFDEEIAPFWKVKDKQWYKMLKENTPPAKQDFDGYFNLRKKLMDSTLITLEEGAKAAVSAQS